MMIRKDDRTPAQRETHRWAVVGCDSFLSGWGHAEGGYSRVAWAYDPKVTDGTALLRRIQDRPDMRYVTHVDLRTYRPSRNTAHFHIYVVTAGDPAHPDRLE